MAARVYVEGCDPLSVLGRALHCVSLLSPACGVTESSLLNSNRVILGILGTEVDCGGVCPGVRPPAGSLT